MEDPSPRRQATWDGGLVPTSWWWASGQKPTGLKWKIVIEKQGKSKGGLHRPRPSLPVISWVTAAVTSPPSRKELHRWFLPAGVFPVHLFLDGSFETYRRFECPLNHLVHPTQIRWVCGSKRAQCHAIETLQLLAHAALRTWILIISWLFECSNIYLAS